MKETATKPDASVPANESSYDPIRMLRIYLKDNPTAPAFLANYLINRLGDQITWYDNKSGFFKRKWEGYRKIIIVLSALIPFLVGFIGFDFNGKEGGELEQYISVGIKLFVGAAGVIIAILEGFNSLLKSQELYVDYRVTRSQLQQEFSYFLGHAGDYANLEDNAAYAKLISNAEGLMANQNNRWSEVARQKEKAEEIQAAMQKFMQDYVEPRKPQPPAPPAPPAGGDNGGENDEPAPPSPQPTGDGGNG